MIEKTKEVRINVRLEKETRDKFQQICKSKAVNSSELIRQWIEKYIKEHSD
ncbi:ribbon-helix-helix protein, CopG family [uncultured Megasphaera sp.]|jgi:metal-responsive CopG/Arc/MetJ family transcriptional regulator|uniref:ribbon-helix-helix protein, CopG family n=1 Tax=uncultured Megasphaera sp. TaxID=165188 RepID=UPI00345175CD